MEEPTESIQEELVNVEEYFYDDDYEDLVETSYFLKKNTQSFTCLAQCEFSNSSLLGHLNFSVLKDPGLDETIQSMRVNETKSAIGRKSSVFSQSLLEEDSDNKKYESMCKELNIGKCTRILKNLNTESLDLKYYGVNLKQIKAMATALKVNTSIKTLDLENNFLTPEAAGIIGDLLTENGTLLELNLKECRIGPEGAEKLNEGIQNTQFIEDLDLSFNSLQNRGLRELTSGLCENTSIKKLNLGHNNLTEECCADLEKILIENNYIMELDLSWNFLNTTTGLKKLSNGLKLNNSIASLNMSWNGLVEKPPIAQLCKYIRNSKLKHLDLSGNRLTGSALRALRNAINKNDTLQVVNLANNCLTPTEAFNLANLLINKPNLKTLNMDHIVVEKPFLKLQSRIKKLGKTVTAGHVVGNYVIHGPDVKKLLFDRCKFLAMKPKKKKAKKDFGHVILSLPENPIKRPEFEATIKKLKVKKIDPDLITELLKQFKATKGKINTAEMIKSYMLYYPGTTLPLVKEKKKKGKKGEDVKEKKGVAFTDLPALPRKSGFELVNDAKELIKQASANLLVVEKIRSGLELLAKSSGYIQSHTSMSKRESTTFEDDAEVEEAEILNIVTEKFLHNE